MFVPWAGRRSKPPSERASYLIKVIRGDGWSEKQPRMRIFALQIAQQLPILAKVVLRRNTYLLTLYNRVRGRSFTMLEDLVYL